MLETVAVKDLATPAQSEDASFFSHLVSMHASELLLRVAELSTDGTCPISSDLRTAVSAAAGSVHPEIAWHPSFGALHAMNTLLRRPDLFAGTIAMSGVYDLKSYSKGYFVQDVYFNSPMDYVPNLTDENILSQLRQKKIIIYTGSGEYEDPSGSWKMAGVLGDKQIPNYVECWDQTWRHDWPTWREMLPTAIQMYL